MSVSWDTFERYRQKGLDARRAGQWDSAHVYLLEAARAMAMLGKEAQGEELRDGRVAMAERLLELGGIARLRPKKAGVRRAWHGDRHQTIHLPHHRRRKPRVTVGQAVDRERKTDVAI